MPPTSTLTALKLFKQFYSVYLKLSTGVENVTEMDWPVIDA